MIVPSIGTSMVAFRLICARLQFHVSGASKPRLASSASAGNSGCSLRGRASSLTTSFKAVHRVLSCLRCRLVGRCYILKPGRPNGLHPYWTSRACIFDAFSAQAVVYWGNHPCGDKNGDELHVPCYLQVLGFEVRGDASDLSVNDSCV